MTRHSKGSLFLFWALLLLPTLVLAGAALVLLAHEQERISQSAADALEERARAISDTIHITVETVERQLSRSLLEMAAPDPTRQLLAWEKANPLVRHVFVFFPGKGLRYPEPGMASTEGERQFVRRYDRLFSGRLAFDFNAPQKAESAPSGTPAGGAAYQGRKTLFSLARKGIEKAGPAPAVSDGSAVSGAAPAAPGPSPRTGWIPWFSENSLCILGWARADADGPVYGMELETMTLLSRLVVDFPNISEKGVAMGLSDGSGSLLHQAGFLAVPEGRAPHTSIPVSPLLPHWQIDIFLDARKFTGSRNFFTLALVVVGLLLLAILSSGFLITRYTLDQIRDARQKTSFVSSVSHELKTPLTSIRMYAELLLSKRVTDTDKQERYLSVMVAESRRLTRLINNVLDFGRLEQGRKTYRATEFDLAEWLKAVVSDHRLRMEKAGLEIDARYPAPPCPVTTDRDALSQVLLNLLDNAIKYAGGGGYIGFALERAGKGWRIDVRDRGPGIPKKHHQAVFDKFFRIDNSLTAAKPGSGLGLAIARQILRDLGGDLELAPDTAKGCCFIIRIQDHENHSDRRR